MEIWRYGEVSHDLELPRTIGRAFGKRRCPFCSRFTAKAFLRLENKDTVWGRRSMPVGVLGLLPPGIGGIDETRARLYFCPICGWWCGFGYATVHHQLRLFQGDITKSKFVVGAAGCLKRFDHPISPEIEQAELELLQYWDTDKGRVKGATLEGIVAHVMRSMGYYPLVRGGPGDRGIDIEIYHGPEGRLLGLVQVKGTSYTIQPKWIREFTGALVDHGCTRGVFVTTSDFQPGAHQLAKRLQSRANRLDIELVDGARLLEALEISRESGDKQFERLRNNFAYELQPLPEYTFLDRAYHLIHR